MKDVWLHGYRPRPEFYHRLSIDWVTANKLALKGYQIVYEELNVKLYFTQALIAGIILENYKLTLSVILGTGLGKTFVMAVVNLIRAKRGEAITAFSPDKELNLTIFKELANAVKNSPDYSKILFDSSSKSEALNRGASQRRFAFPSGGYVDLALAKNYTSVHSSVYLDEYSMLDDETAAGAQGRAGFYVSPDGRPGTIIKTSNPHVMNHSYLDVTKEPLSENEAVIWGDYRLNLAEGKLLERTFAELPENLAYLRGKDKYTEEERMLLFDRSLEIVKNTSFFRKDGDDLRILYLSEFGVNSEKAFFTTMPKIDDSPMHSERSYYFAGNDVATRGTDQSVYALLEVDSDKSYIRIVDFTDVKPRPWIDHVSPRVMANNVIELLDANNVLACAIDATGVGEGQFDSIIRSEEIDTPIIPVRFGDGPSAWRYKPPYDGPIPERMRGELFLDLKSKLDFDQFRITSKCWAKLEPELQAVMNVPQEERVRIKIEAKDLIIKRLGHSTDYLDAVMLAVHAYIMYDRVATHDVGEQLDTLIEINNGD